MKNFTLAILLGLTTASSVWADPNVPANITTPEVVKTNAIGDLHFNDGYPTDETMNKVQQYMLTQRAVNVFADGIPTTSLHAILEGLKAIGAKANNTIAVTYNLFDNNSLWLTPNTTTPYAMAEIDVKDGPVVIEIKTSVLSFIDNAYFEYVGDIGIANPADLGKGANYLLVHESYKGKIPEGYIVFRTSTYRNWFLARIDSVQAIPEFEKTFKFYPLGKKTETNFINYSGVKMNTIHANNVDFYHELNAVIQYEPAHSGDPHFKGMAAAIGIVKGKPFNPKGKHLQALVEGAAIANVHARNQAFRPANKEAYFYKEARQWFLPFGSTMSYLFEKNGRKYLDDRTAFHYLATGITPLMTAKFDGKGSSYIVSTRDSMSRAFDGNSIYTIILPPKPPMKRFWSFNVYDNQTRSLLVTDQTEAGIDSRKDLLMNDDGSVTVTFSAKKPKGKSNWVQTLPNKGFFVMYRMYSPTQDWHDKKYIIGDLVKQ